MCAPASFIITKDRAFWSKNTDHHSGIRLEHGLCDSSLIVKSVAVEVLPPGGNLSRPLNEWEFKTDQDILPDWYDPEQAERSAREALPAWYAARVVAAGAFRGAIR